MTAAASFALAVPERASAANPPCPEGHFCIWEHAGHKGGRYSSGGSDKGSALYNNGEEGRRDDVVIYLSVDDDIDRKYARFCLREGTLARNLANVGRNDAIVGYRWATDRECEDAGTL